MYSIKSNNNNINNNNNNSSTSSITTTATELEEKETNNKLLKKQSNNINNLTSTTSDSENLNSDRGYTIVVPANVRFRGLNMHLDLKFDQKTLEAASDITKAVEEVVTSATRSGSSTTLNTTTNIESSTSSTTTNLNNSYNSTQQSQLNFSLLDYHQKSGSKRLVQQQSPSQPLLMDATVGEGSSADDFKSQNVTSTTTEQQLSNNYEDEEKVEDKKNLQCPISSIITINSTVKNSTVVVDNNNMDESITAAAADTTVSTSAGIAEEATSTSSLLKESHLTLSLMDKEDQENRFERSTPRDEIQQQSMSSLSQQILIDYNNKEFVELSRPPSQCLPSSTAVIAEEEQQQLRFSSIEHNSRNSLNKDEGKFHDIQPCSSTNVPTQQQISSSTNNHNNTNNDTHLNLDQPIGDTTTENIKKKAEKASTSQSSYCEHIDIEKGQCKQRAILQFKYCIRHILLDPTAPYKQCQHQRKSKNKKGEEVLCTNAIRCSKNEIYCSTHLIMQGIIEPKKKKPGKNKTKLVENNKISEEKISLSSNNNNNNNNINSEGISNSEQSNYNHMCSPYETNRAAYGDSITNSYGKSNHSWDQMSSSDHTSNPTTSFNTPNQTPYYQQAPQQQQQHPSTPLSVQQFQQQQKPYEGAQLGIMNNVDGGVGNVSYPNNNNEQSRFIQSPYITQDQYGQTIDGNTYQVNLQQQHQQHQAQHQQQQKHFHVIESPTTPSSGGQQQQQQYSTMYQNPNLTTQQHNSSPIRRNSLPQQQQQLLHNYTNVRSPSMNSQQDPQYNTSAYIGQGHTTVFVPPSATTSQSQQHQQQQIPQNNNNNNNFSISRLSKQHPQLAAKLLQPSTLATNSQNLRNNLPQQQQQIFEVKRDLAIQKNDGQNNCGSISQQIYPQQQQQHQNSQLIGGSGNLPPTGTIIRTSYLPQKLLNGNGVVSLSGPVLPLANSAEFSTNTREFILNQQQAQHFQQQQQQQMPIFVAGVPQQQQQQINFNSVQCNFLNIMPTPSVKLLERFNTEPSPIKYNLFNYDLENLNDEQKIHRDYLNNDEVLQKRTHKNITLRQKRQKIRIPGSFRAIPPIDNICKIMENYDFESSDLFPLGLEPSDDENSSDDSFPEFGSEWNSEIHSPPWNRLELYLLKKQLRLESSRLVKRAKIAVPVVQTAKHFKNCVGAAFRARAMNRRREALTGVELPRLRTCLYFKQLDENERTLAINSPKLIECSNICLPNSNHCQEHILYNTNQKLFAYCSRRSCGRPVLCVESAHTDGLCRKHFEESENLDKLLTNPPTAPTNSSSNPENLKLLTQQKKSSSSTPNPINGNNAISQIRRNIPSNFSSNTRISNIPLNIPPSGPNSLNNSLINGSTTHRIIAESTNASAPAAAMTSASNNNNNNNNNNLFYDDNNPSDHMNDADVVEGDVILASVAKEWGFEDDREFNVMLARLPVDESIDNNDIDDNEGLLGNIKQDDEMDLGHSWADVEQFLRSEGYGDNGGENQIQQIHCSTNNSSIGASANEFQSTTNYEPLIYHEMH